MAIDFFVYWKKQAGKWKSKSGLPLRPTVKHIGIALEDFFRGIGTVTDDKQGKRYFVTLPGQPCNPCVRLVDDDMKSMMQCQHKERWIEVYYGSLARNIDVITRQPDEITLVLALGFAKFCARFWQAKLDAEE